jgi:hypothetical protein
MLKDIATIRIQGANFDSPTSLSLFEPKDGKDKAGNTIFNEKPTEICPCTTVHCLVREIKSKISVL